MTAKRIVVVDDLPEVGAIFRALFREPNYQVEFFRDAAEAMTHVETPPAPDLVVLDINMPGMNGFEACRRLKSRPGTAAIPVAMFTEWDRVMDIATGLQAGADYFLSKDTEDEQLVYRVEDIFRSRDGDDSHLGIRAGDLADQGADIFHVLEDGFNTVVRQTVVESLGAQATQLVFGRAMRHVGREYPFLSELLRDAMWLDLSSADSTWLAANRQAVIAGFASLVAEVLRLLQRLTGSAFVRELQEQMEKKLVRPNGA